MDELKNTLFPLNNILKFNNWLSNNGNAATNYRNTQKTPYTGRKLHLWICRSYRIAQTGNSMDLISEYQLEESWMTQLWTISTDGPAIPKLIKLIYEK